MPPDLPFGIIDNIVNQADTEALLQLSMVDRQIMQLCRSILFSEVSFWGRSGKSSDEFLDLIPSPFSSFPNALREISFWVISDETLVDNPYPFKGRSDAESLGSRLFNVKSVTIDVFDWRWIPQDIVRFIASIPLAHLTLTNGRLSLRNSHFEWLSILPTTLQFLTMANVYENPSTREFEEYDDPIDVSDQLEKFQRPTTFDYLDFISLKCFYSVWDPRIWPAVSSRINMQRLSLDTIRDLLPEQLAFVSRFLRGVGPQLDRLYFTLDWWDYTLEPHDSIPGTPLLEFISRSTLIVLLSPGQIGDFINLSTCVNLSQLHFRIDQPNAQLVPPFRDIARTAALISSERLESVIINWFGKPIFGQNSAGIEDILLSLPWLDVLRQSVQAFRSLKRLRLVFVQSDGAGFKAAFTELRENIYAKLQNIKEDTMDIKVIWLREDDHTIRLSRKPAFRW